MFDDLKDNNHCLFKIDTRTTYVFIIKLIYYNYYNCYVAILMILTEKIMKKFCWWTSTYKIVAELMDYCIFLKSYHIYILYRTQNNHISGD